MRWAAYDSKSLLELRHVCNGSIDSVLVWSMRIDHKHLQSMLLGCILSPRLSPRIEEALLGCKAIDWAWWLWQRLEVLRQSAIGKP